MDITIETLREVLKILPDANLEKYIRDMEAAGKATAALGEISKVVGDDVVNKIKGMTSAAEEFIKSFGGFSGAADQMREAGSKLFDSLIVGAQEYLNESDNLINVGIDAALAFEPLVNFFPKAITGMGQLGSAGYDAGFKISTAFQGTKELLAKIMPESGVAWLEGMSDGATAAFGLQRELVSLAAAQGNLSSMMDDSGEKFKDLNQAYFDMTSLAYDSATATGQTVSSMMDMAKAMGAIPGSLTQSVDVGDDVMSQLVATSKLATGFMRSQGDVVSNLNTLYTDMGISGTKALESLANIYEKAGDSKLRFEEFTKTVLSIAQSFKILGDNTNAAANVVHAFDEAFKNSDISPAAMNTVITSLTSGIQGMDRAKQAFVSSASGGPGGLAGAFQIEYALQTGNMDEVLQKTMTAMQAQFGGQVLTLQDAAQNPALAGEFYKQVQYLTQVAGVAKDDREAYRILEAMQSGVMDILQPGGGGEERPGEALEVAVDRGTSQQERTTSAIMRFHQDMELGVLMQNQLMAGMSERMNVGLKIPEFMADKTRESAARGAIGPEESRTFVPEDKEDIYKKFGEGVLEPMLTPLKTAAAEAWKKGGVEKVRQTFLPPKEEEELSRTPLGLPKPEEELARTPVGLPKPEEELARIPVMVPVEEEMPEPLGFAPEMLGISKGEQEANRALGILPERDHTSMLRPPIHPPVRPGVEAGMVPIAGEEPIVQAPARLESNEVTRRAQVAGFENGEFQRTDRIEIQDFKVTVDLGDPFKEQVTRIVNSELVKYQQGIIGRGAGGVAV